MRASLIVVTYERPDALQRVLQSVAWQTRVPDELIVADDGSGPDVARVVESYARSAPMPVHHLRQEHAGFRAGRMRNLGVAAATGDYVVLIDGDMVLHPRFVQDHVEAARPGHWTQGVRIMLDEAATRRVLRTGRPPAAWERGLGLRRRAYAVHAPGLARPLQRAANRVVAVKSCNQAFWRDDLLRTNGYDEDLTGWGSEDKELCARLVNMGVRRQTLVFAAIAWHLAHRPASRAAARANRERWLETVRSGRTRCARGIDQHLADGRRGAS
jgi:glycosyltransferase involved in cell wall biosynthesis